MHISLSTTRRAPRQGDALMARCKRLAASLTATFATRRRLLDGVLAKAVARVDDHERESAE